MQPSSPSVGLNVGHLFWTSSVLADADAALAAIAKAQADGDQVVVASMLGHKADLATMVLTDDQWRIRRFQTAMVDAGFDLADSYISLTETSEYAQGLPEEMKQARLHPQHPHQQPPRPARQPRPLWQQHPQHLPPVRTRTSPA